MACAPKVLPAGMATRLIRIHCSNHKHLDESIDCAPCGRSKCQQSLSKPHFSRNEGNIVVVRLQEGEGIRLPLTAVPSRSHNTRRTYRSRSKIMAFSRATMILAVVDMLRRGDKQSVMACRQGSRPPERFAQALQPLCNLSHTSKQNAV